MKRNKIKVLDRKEFYEMEDNFCEWYTEFTLREIEDKDKNKTYDVRKYAYWTDQANESKYYDYKCFNTLEEASTLFSSIKKENDKRFRTEFDPLW